MPDLHSPDDGPVVAMERWLTVHQASELVGLQIWLGEELFKRLGTLSASLDGPTLKVFTATWSRRFGDLSLAWRRVLPLLADPRPETFVTSPASTVSEFFQRRLSASGGGGRTEPEIVVVACELLFSAVERHAQEILERASSVADGAVLRQSADMIAALKSAENALQTVVSEAPVEELSAERLAALGIELGAEWEEQCGEYLPTI